MSCSTVRLMLSSNMTRAELRWLHPWL